MSASLFSRAKHVIPGGVNSPVRAFGAVGGEPLFITSAEGATIFDSQGKEYIDFVGSWGPMILGHAHPEVLRSLEKTMHRGTSFGAPTEAEIDLAELVVELVPSVETLRLVSSGTEAVMSALRLARGFTGREYVVKFRGCYHGHSDGLLVSAGSGVATFGIPGTRGVPPGVTQYTLSVDFNDLEQFRETISEVGEEKIAAVVVEPVAGNMGLVLPDTEFLPGLRAECDRIGALLVFDEVMSGFRVALGGAQSRFGVTPDLTTLGKVIGGGLPVGAFGGKREVMEMLAPVGPVYQAGTLSGNPLAVAAGITTLSILRNQHLFPLLEETGQRLVRELPECAGDLPLTAQSCGSMFGFFFRSTPVRSFSDALEADQELFRRFFHGMLDRGVYLAPSPFEAGFFGIAHDNEIITRTIACAKEVMATLADA